MPLLLDDRSNYLGNYAYRIILFENRFFENQTICCWGGFGWFCLFVCLWVLRGVFRLFGCEFGVFLNYYYYYLNPFPIIIQSLSSPIFHHNVAILRVLIMLDKWPYIFARNFFPYTLVVIMKSLPVQSHKSDYGTYNGIHCETFIMRVLLSHYISGSFYNFL